MPHGEADAVLPGQEQLVRAVVEALARSAPIAHMLLDPDGRFLRVNDAMLALTGGTREERIGRSVVDVHPDIGATLLDTVRTVARTGRPVLSQRVAGVLSAQPPERRVWRITTYPVVVDAGQLAAIGVICEDVTLADQATWALDVARQVAARLLSPVTVDEALHVVVGDVPTMVGAIWAELALVDPSTRQVRVVQATRGGSGGDLLSDSGVLADGGLLHGRFLDGSRLDGGDLLEGTLSDASLVDGGLVDGGLVESSRRSSSAAVSEHLGAGAGHSSAAGNGRAHQGRTAGDQWPARGPGRAEPSLTVRIADEDDGTLGAVAARSGAPLWLTTEVEARALLGWYRPPVGRAWVGLPLATRQGVVGGLALGYATATVLTPGTRTILVQVADQCALALERAQLFERVEDAARRANHLQQVTAALARATTEQDVASTVFDVGRQVLGAIAGGLGLVDQTRRHRLVATFGWDHLSASDLLEDRTVDDQSLSALVLRTGTARFVASVDELCAVMPPERAHRLTQGGTQGSWAVVPVAGATGIIGTLSLSFPSGRTLAEAERTFLATVAGQVAAAVDRIRRHRSDHEVAVTLQRALLPDQLPVVSGLAVAVRYRPGTATAEVGGDWYDVFRLGAGSTALVVGDVAGHDLAAAGAMGRLRAQLRACADDRHGPADALMALDGLVRRCDDDVLATVALAAWEPVTGALAVALAGQPPPVVVAEGRCRILDVPTGPPIGANLHATARQACTTVVPPTGATLVLYSDGLVESRGRPVTIGIDALRQVVEAMGAEAEIVDPNDMADRLITALCPPDGWADDVVVVVARLRPTAPPQPLALSRDDC